MPKPGLKHLAAPLAVTVLAFLLFGLASEGLSPIRRAPDDAAIRVLRQATGVGAWLALAWLGARAADLFLLRLHLPSGRGPQAPRLLSDLLRAVLFTLALVAILLFVFEQEAMGLIATSSVLIAVIGFALRNIISDVFSGIALNFDHPYQIGDWIEVGSKHAGKVVEINWRATRLVTRDGIAVVVPNGMLAGASLVNYSAPEESFRTVLRVPLAPSVPVDRAKRILLAGALGVERTYPNLNPDVIVQDYDGSGVIFLVRFWVPNFGQENACRDAVASSVLHSLHRAGLAVSYPRQEVLLARHRAVIPERQPQRALLLAHVGLFEPFDDAERRQLAAHMDERFFENGATIVRQGEAGASLFVVAEGALDVLMTKGEARDARIDRMAPGDVFGEMSLLTGQPRSASVIAATDAVVYEIHKEHLDPILRARPEIAQRLAAIMAERQRLNPERLSAALSREQSAPLVTTQDFLGRLRALFGLR